MMNTRILGILLLTWLRVRAQSGRQNAEGEPCTCIPISECGFKKPVVMMLRQIDACENRLHICCTDENMNPGPDPNRVANTCGHRNRNGLRFKLINEDLESQYAEFPWMIEISVERERFFSKPTYRYIAGGSLITPFAVLTAAHKMADINVTQIRVRAGEWERNTINEPYPNQDRKVSRIIKHEGFNAIHGYNGISLLILETEINFEPHINKICLPPINFDFTGNQCIVTGWGTHARSDDDNNNNSSNIKPVDILKKIDVPVVDDRVCQDQLRKTVLGPGFYLHPSFMCAGGERDKDACFGDGGSPLVCPIPNAVDKYYLAGIVIGGVNCGLDKVPGLYIEVSKFLPWINDHLEDYD